MTTDNFCFYLRNSLIQTSRTGGQQYTDTSPFSIPCINPLFHQQIASIKKYFMNTLFHQTMNSSIKDSWFVNFMLCKPLFYKSIVPPGNCFINSLIHFPLFHQYTISSIHYFINTLFHQYIISSIHYFINTLFHQYTISSIHYFINTLFHQFKDL